MLFNLPSRGNDDVYRDILKKILEKKSKEWVVKTVDAFLIHSQVPIVGSVLYCNLAFAFEHTGIYVGDEMVVHLNGDGIVEKVTLQDFTARLEGNNPSRSIFCATDINGKSIGSKVVADKALDMIGSYRKYNLVLDNCHCFTYYCLTGRKTNIGSFNMIQEVLKQRFGLINWRAINFKKTK